MFLKTLATRSKLLRRQGFSLVVTLIMLSLLSILVLGMLSLSSVALRNTGHERHQQQARANARLALQLAIADLQRYAGPDQRVTGRADLTDSDWTDTNPQVANPFYTCVWDVSGSEMDHSWNGAYDTVFDPQTGKHRAGMNPGHDFDKVPAILVSGNSQFDLTDETGAINRTSYPEGYIGTDSTATADQSFVSIIPQSHMLGDTEITDTPPDVRVPLVSVEDKGRYGFWIGDESVKNRINLGNRHEPSSAAAQALAQRSVIEPFRSETVTTPDATAPYSNIFTLPSASIPFLTKLGSDWNYSADLTTESRSLLTDVRSGGLKDDLTFALYRDQTDVGMPDELGDLAPLFDSVAGKTWGGPGGTGNSNAGGISPFFLYLREWARSAPADPTTPRSIGDAGLTPVLSQVQSAVHVAYRFVPPTGFKVYYSVFPSVTLWNPYDVPIRLDKAIKVDLERRSGTSNWWLNLFRANYRIQNSDGSTGLTVGNVFNNSQWARGGWNFSVRIPSSSTVLLPGQAMVFSPSEIEINDTPVAKFTPPPPDETWTGSGTRSSFTIELEPGWRPGKGLVFNLDDRVHDATSFNPDGNTFPKISFGLGGGVGYDNIIWTARYEKSPGSWKVLSYWSRLNSRVQSNSPFFDPPLTTDAAQDSRGNFPGLLHKYALRMADDYLSQPSNFVHVDQATLNFPYISNHNPRAVYHAAIGDSYATNRNANATKFWTSEGTECASTLMGALYDYQAARTIYTVPTTDENETFTYIGSDYLGGAENMVLAEAPVQTTQSLPNGESSSVTSFTQFNSSMVFQGSDTPRGPLRYLWLSTCNFPAFPIGNSIADYRLNINEKPDPLTSTSVQYIGSLGRNDNQGWRVGSAFFDLSYLINDRLYDRYFLSTVPQSGVYQPEAPLINSRIVPQTTDIDDLHDIKSSKHLLLDGGFNVNSTSVAAWELLLSSSLGVKRPGTPDDSVTFPARIATGKSGTDELTGIDEACSGDSSIRLTPAEVRDLAEAIVAQVKRRGPFPSVAAFINRTNRLQDVLRSDPNASMADGIVDVRYSGAIQAAIDAIGVNETIEAIKPITSDDFVSDNRFYPGVTSLRPSAYANLPGLLKQSDILRQIDSQITVRGDTFVIRAFGTSEDGSGKTVAKAACEAVIQRSVDYFDPVDPAEKAPYTTEKNSDGTVNFSSNLSEQNQRYGRRFEIQSFRWLSSSEVAAMTIN